jgi:stage V sporulation protein SpoVS
VSADMAGIDALRRVRAAGADLVGVPGYIQLKIDSEAARPTNLPLKGPRRI